MHRRQESSVRDEEKGRAPKGARSKPGGDDPSTRMWSLSISHAEKFDTAIADRWKADMDGILIYTGVFSATVAAFLIESYKYLKPDPSEVSSRLLRQLTQELVGISNGNTLTPPTLDLFTPQRYAINVNILWFLSLCISLSCGLGATLVQQWVRRYIKLTQQADTPTHRVRIRTFLFTGVQQFHVHLVVENISILLHASIFLFFAGLVEFLFALNDEVAQVVRAITCFFAALYIVLTAIPVLFQQCPFQTPLTSVFWYIANITTITFLFPFTCSNRVKEKIKDLRNESFDSHILNLAKDNKVLDKDAVRYTLDMCRDDGEIEDFLDAVPGYLQIDNNVATRVDDIGSLLKKDGNDLPLGRRILHLFSSCIHGEGKMDDAARRRRAITCSHAVSELLKASSSVTLKKSTLDLPHPIGHKLRHLSHDHDPKIAFAAVRTAAVMERTLLDVISNADERKEPAKSSEAAKVLAETIGDNDPASPRHQAGLGYDVARDRRLIAVTEFTSNILALTKCSWSPSRQDLREIESTFKQLCRDLNARDFSHVAQGRFVDVLCDIWQAQLNSAPTGKRSSTETHHSVVIDSLKPLKSTLDARFIELLKQRGFPAL